MLKSKSFFDVEKNKFVFIILKAGQNTAVHLVVTHSSETDQGSRIRRSLRIQFLTN